MADSEVARSMSFRGSLLEINLEGLYGFTVVITKGELTVYDAMDHQFRGEYLEIKIVFRIIPKNRKMKIILTNLF